MRSQRLGSSAHRQAAATALLLAVACTGLAMPAASAASAPLAAAVPLMEPAEPPPNPAYFNFRPRPAANQSCIGDDNVTYRVGLRAEQTQWLPEQGEGLAYQKLEIKWSEVRTGLFKTIGRKQTRQSYNYSRASMPYWFTSGDSMKMPLKEASNKTVKASVHWMLFKVRKGPDDKLYEQTFEYTLRPATCATDLNIGYG